MFHSTGAERFEGAVLAADYIKTPCPAPGTGVPILDDDEVTVLLQSFLQTVHVMNPVMDCTTLSSDVREVAELGLQWDGKTCLVVSRPIALQVRSLTCNACT